MLLLGRIKKILEKNRFYTRLRYSPWMYRFWLWLRADVRKELQAKNAFYRSVLPPGIKLIFDIGANEGTLTELFSRHSQTLIAVEPSARNVSILSAKFGERKNIIIVPKAVSDSSGYKDWYEDKTDYAMGTLSQKWNDNKENNSRHINYIETISLDDLIREFGVPGYIKIDVEGYEHKVIQGLTQHITLLSFEAILPLFLEETVLCINRLVEIHANARFNYSLDNSLVYTTYQLPSQLLQEIKSIRQTIDIFCTMNQACLR